MFTEKTHWKPPHVYNRYFGEYKRLEHKYDMNPWEIVMIIIYNHYLML